MHQLGTEKANSPRADRGRKKTSHPSQVMFCGNAGSHDPRRVRRC